MRNSPARVLVVSLALLAGCAGTSARRAMDGASARNGESEQVQGPHVPAGTHIAVRLNAPLDLSTTTPGQGFEGYLSDTLRGADGRTFIQGGAMIRGTLAVGGHTGRLSLRGATVESPVGPLALRAVVHTGMAGETDSLAGEGSASGVEHASLRTASGGERGASSHEALAASGNGFVLPRGAEVDVVLTRPLLAPGASVLAR